MGPAALPRWCLQVGWVVLAHVPVFFAEHSETGARKSLKMGWGVGILILLLVCGKQGCVTMHERAPVEQCAKVERTT